VPTRLIVPPVLEYAASVLDRCAACLESAGRHDLSEWLWCLDLYGKALVESTRGRLSDTTAAMILACWARRAEAVSRRCSGCERAAKLLRRALESFIEQMVGFTPAGVTLDAYLRAHHLLWW